MRYQSIKGFRDIFGSNAKNFIFIENTARKIFRKYNYQEIRTPLVESAELFLRSIGETTDIVEKELYVFEDKGKRRIALRPEGTACVVRAYIENNLSQKYATQSFFYIGQMFRQDRPQAGRFREFSQIGCEYFGNTSVYADIEVILLAKEIIERCNVNDIKIEINSLGCEKCRPTLVSSVKNILRKEFNMLCDDCKRRMEKNPLRALDCKVDGKKFSDIKFVLCDICNSEFEKLKTGLSNAGVDFAVSNTLVRGLDYYTKTVFEIKSGVLGSQNSVCAGGRYDNLVKDLGGAPTPAVGFAIGTDRLAEIIEKTSCRKQEEYYPVFVAAFGNDKTLEYGFNILRELRDAGIVSAGGYFTKSLKAQMRIANTVGSKYAVIIGDEENKKKVVVLRDMTAKSQKEVIPQTLITMIKNTDSGD
ncbi:MAG: histidine--tRNA ligase [Elusimicrobia bacterium]|nr:histidine--tRNA ligase [Elusimicrobiota bacterium]